MRYLLPGVVLTKRRLKQRSVRPSRKVLGRRQEGRAESSGDGSSRVGRHRPGYKSPLAPCRRRHTSLALWTVRNSLVSRACHLLKAPRPGTVVGPRASSPPPTTSDFNPPVSSVETLWSPASYKTSATRDRGRKSSAKDHPSRPSRRRETSPPRRIVLRERHSPLSRDFTGSGIVPRKLCGIQQMNVINLHSSTMILLGILASTTIIGLTSSAPLSSYERRDVSDDRPKIFLLIDQRIPELEDEMLNSENDLGSSSDVMRTKRIGSLSIVNNLDVLRQRVLLELARRKQLQDQRQVDENRRFLETIGKRSVSDAGRIVKSGMKNNRERSAAANRNEWIEENNLLFRGSQDDRTVRVQANELRQRL